MLGWRSIYSCTFSSFFAEVNICKMFGWSILPNSRRGIPRTWKQILLILKRRAVHRKKVLHIKLSSYPYGRKKTCFKRSLFVRVDVFYLFTPFYRGDFIKKEHRFVCVVFRHECFLQITTKNIDVFYWEESSRCADSFFVKRSKKRGTVGSR